MKIFNFHTHPGEIEKLPRCASLRDETTTSANIFQLIKIFTNIRVEIAS